MIKNIFNSQIKEIVVYMNFRNKLFYKKHKFMRDSLFFLSSDFIHNFRDIRFYLFFLLIHKFVATTNTATLISSSSRLQKFPALANQNPNKRYSFLCGGLDN